MSCSLLLFFYIPLLSTIIYASDFSCLSLSQVESQISISSPGLSLQLQTYPSVFLTFLLGSLKGTSDSTCVKYSLSSSIPQMLLFHQCSYSQGFESLFFYMRKTQNIWVAFIEPHIQLITKAHKYIDFTFFLRTSMPAFLPGMFSFAFYLNTEIPNLFCAMDSFDSLMNL